jgi:translation initiation factor 2 beta subunit (eIF-2beta)/eIF-5
MRECPIRVSLEMLLTKLKKNNILHIYTYKVIKICTSQDLATIVHFIGRFSLLKMDNLLVTSPTYHLVNIFIFIPYYIPLF